MSFDKDDRDSFWKKDDPTEKKNFDFAAFLGTEDLDDKVTQVTDGKDLLSPDAFGEFSPDYIPRRPGDGEHGRHEAPEPEQTQEEAAPERPVDFSDPRYAAPERPRVVVAEPRPKVYITPPGVEGYEPPVGGGNGSGSGEKKKWLLAAVISLAVVAVILIAVVSAFSGLGGSADPDATPKNTSEAVTPTPGTTDSAAATATPSSTDTAKKTYSITVTAGSGGSVSPAGVATVEEGGSITFTIQPSSGHAISQLLVDGVAVNAAEQYTFTNVTSNHTIYAVFQTAATATPAPTATPVPVTDTPAPTDTPIPATDTPAPTDVPVEPAPEGEGELPVE